MSVAPSQSPLGAETKVHEPSMEEILASIRRIIADDQSMPGRAGSDASPRGAVEPPASVSSAPEPMLAAPAPDVPPIHHFASERDGFVVPAQKIEAVPEPPVMPEPPAVSRSGGVPSWMTAAVEDAAPHPEPEMPRDPQHALAALHAPKIETPRESSGRADVVDLSRGAPAELPLASHGVETEEATAPPSYEPAVSHGSAISYGSTMSPRPATPPEADPSDYQTPLGSSTAPEENPALFSAVTDSSIASAFNMLAATRLADNSEELMAMVREMIRPVLKNWLDDNLPTMVERMVRAEIERVARGGR